MMKHEFEQIAGYEVTNEDYTNIIEPMYMATNLTKQEFVKVIEKSRFALKTREQLKRKMKMYAKHLKDTCEHYTDYEAKEKLENIIKEYNERFGAYKGGYIINSRYTLEYLGECRGCTYPASVEFYNREYHTVETLALV